MTEKFYNPHFHIDDYSFPLALSSKESFLHEKYFNTLLFREDKLNLQRGFSVGSEVGTSLGILLGPCDGSEEENVVGNSDGAEVGDVEVDGVREMLGKLDGLREMDGAGEMFGGDVVPPKIVTSDDPKSPPEVTSSPFKVTLYDPDPKSQHIPSP